MTKSVRFWTTGPTGDWVRLTVREGDPVAFDRRGPTEEGWSGYGERYALVGDAVECESYSEGRDCDGYTSEWRLSRCAVDRLAVREVEGAPGLLPDWEPVDTRCRDEYAERMGY